VIDAKSTGTTNIRDAIRQAEAYWDDLRLQRHLQTSGHPGAVGTTAKSDTKFDRLADSWLDRKEAEAGSDERRLRALKDAKHAYFGKTGFAAFFAHEDGRSITTDRIREYLLFQESTSKKTVLASSTKKRMLAILRELFKHAYEGSVAKT